MEADVRYKVTSGRVWACTAANNQAGLCASITLLVYMHRLCQVILALDLVAELGEYWNANLRVVDTYGSRHLLFYLCVCTFILRPFLFPSWGVWTWVWALNVKLTNLILLIVCPIPSNLTGKTNPNAEAFITADS